MHIITITVMQDVDGILTRFADLQEEAEISRSQSEQDRQEADRLLADAQQLYTDTNTVSLQQLQGQYYHIY